MTDDTALTGLEGRRTFLGSVIYDAMFELQINLVPDGAQKAEYIAAAVVDALESDRRAG